MLQFVSQEYENHHVLSSADLNIKDSDLANSSNKVSVTVHAILSIIMSRAFCKKLLKIDFNSSMPIEMKHAYFMALKDKETEAPIEQTSILNEK